MEDNYSRKEIESHSSAITNIRIGNIKDAVWRAGLEVTATKPDPQSTMGYFSAILQWYLETHFLYSEEINKDIKVEIDRAFTKGLEYQLKVRVSGALKAWEVENWLQLCLRLQYLMNTASQNLKYYLKIGTQEPKGVDAALKIFDYAKRVKSIHEKELENAK